MRQFGTPWCGSANDVALDSAGNLYVVGTITKGPVERRAFVRKYGSDGNELWTRQFGIQYFDEAFGVALAGEGNLYVGGSTGSLPSQASGQIRQDAFVRKYDSDGNELWTR
jgi:hypothetical protein